MHIAKIEIYFVFVCTLLAHMYIQTMKVMELKQQGSNLVFYAQSTSQNSKPNKLSK